MIRRLAALAAMFALSGCEMAAYYLQAVGGHLDIAGRTQPVERVIADPATPEALRRRLDAAMKIRDYASRELKLPDNGSYRGYADLGRPYVVWNVVAAPEFSLTPVQSCFPVAGCVSYRGFYAQPDADRHAAGLRAQGYDVLVHGVPAYSTLGWFDDPLLSTFIRSSDAELARLLFHELSHQVVYVKGDSTFNESFAVAVEREGVKRWLRHTGREAELKAFEDASRRGREFLRLLDGTRARLDEVYRQDRPREAKLARKAEAYRALIADYAALKRDRWGGFAGYDRFIVEKAPNNALLASFSTYTQLVEGFERLLAAEGGDLARFYARVAELAALDREARRAALGQR